MAELKRPLRSPELATTPATPAAGKRLLYPKADGWYEKNSNGVETKIGPTASTGAVGSAAIYDGGTPSTSYVGVAGIDFGGVT